MYSFGGMQQNDPKYDQMAALTSATIQPIAHLEKEWDLSKFQQKMLEYMNKAAKKLNFGVMPWDRCVEEFCTKFFESYWRALGDRYAYVEKLEFSSALGAAIKYHFPPEVMSTVPSEEDFMQKVYGASVTAFDNCRWYSWGYQIVKNVVPGKVQQKSVSAAVDSSREASINAMASEGTVDSEAFMEKWIGKTMDALRGKDLPQAIAVELFNELVQQGGGLPYVLEIAQGKPPPRWPSIELAVNKAFGGSGSRGPPSFGGAMPGMGGMRFSPY